MPLPSEDSPVLHQRPIVRGDAQVKIKTLITFINRGRLPPMGNYYYCVKNKPGVGTEITSIRGFVEGRGMNPIGANLFRLVPHKKMSHNSRLFSADVIFSSLFGASGRDAFSTLFEVKVKIGQVNVRS